MIELIIQQLMFWYDLELVYIHFQLKDLEIGTEQSKVHETVPMSSNVLESSWVFESTNGLYESSIEQKETINHVFKSVSIIDYLQDNCCFSSTSGFLYNDLSKGYFHLITVKH